MVSLRQRKSKLEYSDIAPGLHDLSDEENAGQGSGSRPPKDDDDISISSGESSEFKPKSPEKQAAEDIAMDEDEGMEEDDEPLRSIHDTHTSPVKRSIKKAPSQSKGKDKAIAPPSVSATPSIRSSPVPKPSEGNPLSHIPLDYLRLLGQSAKNIVKPPEPAPDAQRQAFETWLKKKKGNSREESILDSPLPFFTRLLEDPQNGSVRPKVEWSPKVESSLTAKQEKKEKRNQLNNIALGVPWDLWRGEGWWPEMYIGPEGGGGGKRTEWLMREDVRLGLENIGRFKKSELVFLAQNDAKPYLPKPPGKNGEPFITCLFGPYEKETPTKLSIFDSKSLSETNRIVPRPGFTFYAGGPIWGLDWCPIPRSKPAEFENTQYLAISTLSHLSDQPKMFDKCPPETKGSIQIWSLLPPPKQSAQEDQDEEEDVAMEGERNGGMVCELVLCVEGGNAMQIRWMPLGVWDEFDVGKMRDEEMEIPKLGIIAAVQLDGSVSFYPVPHPKFLVSQKSIPGQPVYLHLQKPLVRLTIPDANCTTFDWLSGSRLAVGLDTGHVVVWDIYDSLLHPSPEPPLPVIYTSVAMSCIRSLSVLRLPPTPHHLGSDAVYVVTGAYDGSTKIVDVRDPLVPIPLDRQRLPIMSTAWSTYFPGPIVGDNQYTAQVVRVADRKGRSRGFVISGHRGVIWDIGTSDYHTMVVTAGADGAVIVVNHADGVLRSTGARTITLDRLYEMDYNTLTDTYRLSDDFLPESQPLDIVQYGKPRDTAGGGESRESRESQNRGYSKIGAWSPEVGIHRCVWNNGGGLGQAGWVGSGGASGVGRVEWVEGVWREK
ncbi:transcription factor C subunit 6 [Cryptococcus neoformans var. grubii Br795]|uniref:Transcription factor C subunit 6 n=1 Tax=Cryptococcus neoformans Tu259-1 TaxID=1230072 RepID=A0A854Q926_CRYNE|nr:transcription factor C subunit 6 [Cryptococcus neoformans var. grubii AD1-83a]OXG15804.1 transcription factor C subunit 6 [Cryptococcus neoformans var. grubii Tu259-1]OXG53775.1 transcription factor C subunit 6 [Cryptococcus neoformans var. grubii MW-RSA1955]OXG56944.1 transcription factor C subunit 6 [Cryptococcus neoformans var. grubii CHC193]OXG60555.1 transcription factor C subunit 6 [Cryptococcus neoformans var. grubii c8]OXG76170.1 transcription factor C subunit 6 [Cryptococcus neofor